MMSRKRAMIAGMTDYTGVGMKDILAHLHDWQAMTEKTIVALRLLRKDVESRLEVFEDPTGVLDYIDDFCDLFERYASDFRRLVEELPDGVRESHVETVSQLYRRSRLEDEECVKFKREFIQHGLRNEQARPILDAIYAEARDTIADYRDLSNLEVRLRAFSTSSPQRAQIVQLRPGIWGMNIDLKSAWKRLRTWWRGRSLT